MKLEAQSFDWAPPPVLDVYGVKHGRPRPRGEVLAFEDVEGQDLPISSRHLRAAVVACMGARFRSSAQACLRDCSCSYFRFRSQSSFCACRSECQRLSSAWRCCPQRASSASRSLVFCFRGPLCGAAAVEPSYLISSAWMPRSGPCRTVPVSGIVERSSRTPACVRGGLRADGPDGRGSVADRPTTSQPPGTRGGESLQKLLINAGPSVDPRVRDLQALAGAVQQQRFDKKVRNTADLTRSRPLGRRHAERTLDGVAVHDE